MEPQQSQPDNSELRAAAAAAVAPDSETAKLLAKKAAGEKLTPAEHGKIGAFQKWLNKVRGRSDSPGQPANAAPVPGNPAAVASLPPGQVSADGLPVVAPNAGFVQRTTGVLVTKLNTVAKRKIKRTAEEAGYDPQAVARLTNSVGFAPDDKELLMELSPDVATAMGIDPKHYPVAVFATIVGCGFTDFWLALDELRRDRDKRRKEEADKAAAAASTKTAGAAANP